MKTLKEFQNKTFIPSISETNLFLKYLDRDYYDFDVFLPSIGKNLQREMLWTIFQKQELIFSILLERHIPQFSFINKCTGKSVNTSIVEVIDGKQRLSAIFDFLDNKFPIIIDGVEVFYNQLPEDYVKQIQRTTLRTNIIYDDPENPMTDFQKFEWFKFINYAGNPMDLEHIKSFNF